ncbi:hypothetical protein CK489_39110 [Bradyrhizobium sp. UFLA03-84]|nr:hypothetical protein CK489_39110 [Bradyrhizobium sp. UFLA03-84]
MNAFWASENFEAFIVFAPPSRGNRCENSNQKWSSLPASDHDRCSCRHARCCRTGAWAICVVADLRTDETHSSENVVTLLEILDRANPCRTS